VTGAQERGHRVELSGPEIIEAAVAGVLRTVIALRKGQHRRPGLGNSHRWSDNVIGAIGERVAAKELDCYFPGRAGIDHTGDIGSGRLPCEVRATEHDHGCLIVHPEDPDDRPFVLITGRPFTFYVRGWIYGREGKRPEYWRTDVAHPAWFVPIAALREIDTLRDSLRGDYAER
jgi:hypothetical protein